MSGEKRTPIQILRDDLDKARKDICDFTRQRERLAEELKRSRQESLAQTAELKKQMERRAQEQSKVVEGLKSDLKETAARHQQQMEKQSREFRRGMQEMEGRMNQKFESIREWTEENLRQQQEEYRRLAADQRRQTEQLKTEIKQINLREDNRTAVAQAYLEDLAQLIETTEHDFPSHKKYAPGQLEKIRRQWTAAQHQLHQDLAPAAVATVQQAHFDLMDLQVDVQQKEFEFEHAHRQTLAAVEALFATVRRNRQVELGEAAVAQEVDHWTDGRYDNLENRILELKNRLETQKDELSIDAVHSILASLDALVKEQEELIREAVERIISSQLRAEMGDSVVESLERQGFRMSGEDCGYMEQDQRQAYVVTMQNRAGAQIVTVITPDEATYQNIMSVNTYNERLYDETVLETRSEEILASLRNAGLQTGATHCEEQAQPAFQQPQELLSKKVKSSKAAQPATTSAGKADPKPDRQD